MTGKWQNSTRARRLPPDWHARRTACWRNAGERCQHTDSTGRCPTVTPLHKTGHIEAGHADHTIAMDDTSPLQWLCAPHHRAKTTREGTAALPRERRTPEPHPGLA